jgi:putative glycosyltransferase (TIGR04348 family)
VNIQLITPAPLRFNNGNKITAVRWLHILRQLQHKVSLKQSYQGAPCDMLIALHARRSYESIRRFHETHPQLPVIVVLTGTDLYRDIRTHRSAQRSLEMATRIVALQRMALTELPTRLHAKTRVIYQSAKAIPGKPPPWDSATLRVSVIGHLRKEKDPLRTAYAVRQLPAGSRIEVLHVGRPLEKPLGHRARSEDALNPHYRWIGEIPHWKARRILARSHLTVITSRIEGSSNVLCEALASSVPVVASKIPGIVGTLGEHYPGYFSVGSTAELKALLLRAEADAAFYRSLRRHCDRLSCLVEPQRELACWRELLGEFK